MTAEKICITCGKTKSLNEFHTRQDGKEVRHIGQCKSCRCERSKKRHKENIEQHRELVKRRYDTFGRFNRYGITAEIYAERLASQGAKCALCGTYTPGGKGVWHIDHAHTGKENPARFNQSEASSFRGILCHRCNVNLGSYEKLVSRVGQNLIDAYLNKPSEKNAEKTPPPAPRADPRGDRSPADQAT